MNPSLQVLIVEDSESDAAMVGRVLRKAGYSVHDERVEDAAAMAAALARQSWDVVISDYAMPQFDAPAALALLQETGLDIPFIVVSGTIGEETAVIMMKAGAHDYLMKDNLLRLAPAVARELREAQSRRERRQAEESLRETERLAQATIDALSAHLCVIDQSGAILAVNRAWREFATANPPIPPHYGLGMNYLTICDQASGPNADEADPFAAGIRAVLNGQTEQFCLEYPCHAPWEERWFLGSVTRFPGDGPLRLVISHQDMTGRKQAEAALAVSTEYLSSIFRVAPIGIGVVSNRVIQEANQCMLDLIGYSRAELMGQNARILYPDEAEYVRVGREKYAQIQERGVGHIETKWRRKDGAIRDILISSTPFDPAEQTAEVTFTALDITERKRTEKELQYQNILLSTQQEASIDGILVVDEQARILTYNRRFVDMWGIPAELVAAKADEPVLQFVTAQVTDSPGFLQRVRYLYEQRQEISREELWLKDGRIFDRYTTSMFGADGRYFGRVWYFRDITERKQAEAALRQSENDFRHLSDFNRQLNDISIAFNEIGDLASLETAIATSFRQLTGAIAATISRYDPQTQTLRVTDAAMPADLLRQIDAFIGVPLMELQMSLPEVILPTMTTHFIDRSNNLAALSFGAIAPETAAKIVTAVGCGQILAIGLSYNAALLGATIAFLPPDAAEIPDHSLRTFAYMASLAITRKKAEESLRDSEARFATIFRANPAAMAITRLDTQQLVDVNAAWQELTGYTYAEAVSSNPLSLNLWVRPEQRQTMIQSIYEQHNGRDEIEIRHKSGQTRYVLMSAELIELAGERYLLTMGQDITERKQAEAEREKLQAQLIQAQKMESIGRLAGGVAHDFNNMLGVIIGRAEMAMHWLDPTHPLFTDLQEISTAANHSADLTRQLLAFARKQLVVPRVLDLNETIESMLTILRRLIGEDIDLVWLPGADVWPVKMDPSQVDQILANLCVNARDAIAGTGKLIIETQNVLLDATYCATHLEAQPGEFDLLAVSDNGCGMTKEVMDKLFEPFFTTKEMGKGTGLGLATIYGIVKQNNGFINVYSEPGQGTTFKIYLPRYITRHRPVRPAVSATVPVGGYETILVAEDELAMLDVMTTVLQSQGYMVLAANTPGKAIELTKGYGGKISMLITDVVMPEMNGRDLAQALLPFQPHLKVLFMSGYTANVIAHQGVLEAEKNFIQKPFSIRDLVSRVRFILDQPSRTD